MVSRHGVTIHHYHADNGLFDTFKFKAKVETSNQTISFCEVNAHHQNGKAENRVKDVTIGTRTSLFHADHIWTNAIHSSLWPAAMKNIYKSTELPTYKLCPLSAHWEKHCHCQIQFITIIQILPVGSRTRFKEF